MLGENVVERNEKPLLTIKKKNSTHRVQKKKKKNNKKKKKKKISNTETKPTRGIVTSAFAELRRFRL